VFERLSRQGRDWSTACLIVAVTLPLFLVGLGDRYIWIPLEARYALVAREMWEGGQWILPHLGGVVYPDKPPLFFWAIALTSSFGAGVSEWTARLPSALAAVGVCLWTWRLGARLFSPRAGILAALVLATSAGFFWSGRQALPDMLLTLWITGACWALWAWLGGNRRNAAILAGVCMGLATLTKGPVGFLLPVLTGLAYLTLQRNWHLARPRESLLCVGSFLVTVLTWYLPAVAQGGVSYAQATLIHHSLERYVHAWEHTAPWYFYMWAFPAEFLPWTLFLPQAFGAVRSKRDDMRGWWFVVGWLGIVLLFFSVSTGKRDIYILPAYPAAALLVGWIGAEWWKHTRERWVAWGMTCGAVLLAFGLWGLAVGLWALSPEMLSSRNALLLPAMPQTCLWISILLGGAGVLLASLALLQRPRLLFGCVVGCTWLAMLAGVVVIYTARFNQRYPIKPFAQAVRVRVSPEHPLRVCGAINDLALRFQLHRDTPLLTQESEIIRYLLSRDPAYCVMDLQGYGRMSELIGQQLPVLVRQEIDRSALLLVFNGR